MEDHIIGGHPSRWCSHHIGFEPDQRRATAALGQARSVSLFALWVVAALSSPAWAGDISELKRFVRPLPGSATDGSQRHRRIGKRSTIHYPAKRHRKLEQLRAEGLSDGVTLGWAKAYRLALDFLGPHYRYMPTHSPRNAQRSPRRGAIYTSRDGTRQVRLLPSDIEGLHGGIPHIHLEVFIEPVSSWRKKSRLSGMRRRVHNFHIFLSENPYKAENAVHPLLPLLNGGGRSHSQHSSHRRAPQEDSDNGHRVPFASPKSSRHGQRRASSR